MKWAIIAGIAFMGVALLALCVAVLPALSVADIGRVAGQSSRSLVVAPANASTSPEHTPAVLPPEPTLEERSALDEKVGPDRPAFARIEQVSEPVAPQIDAWLPEGPHCRRRGCDGPRRVPVSSPEQAARAEALGLGTRRAYDVVLSGPATHELLDEVGGAPKRTLEWPVPAGVMGRGFGYVRRAALGGRLHRGVDIPATVGSAVVAANRGLVVYAGNRVRGYGNLIVLLHADDTRTLYAHLDRAYVVGGQVVERGERIGDVGRTGLTRAPHLHFEYRRRAVPRNPRSRFVHRPSHALEVQFARAQRVRRREGQARLAELRARAERNRERREGRRQQR